MLAKVIKSEEQYAATLSRIDALMDAAPGSAEADELELLALLVETYEEQMHRRELPDAIDAIRFRMEQMGLRQKDLVPHLGSASRVSEVLGGKRPLTLAMMRALNRELGIPAEVLLHSRGGQIPDEVVGLDWRRFPVWEMIKRKWLPAASSASEARERAEEYMRPFLEPALREGLAAAHFRTGVAPDAPCETDYALLAWLARVVAVAEHEEAPPYHPGVVDEAFMAHLVQLSIYEEGPLLAKKFLQRSGIRFVVEPHLSRTKLDGAVLMTRRGNPIIALTLRHDRIDSFWFTLCHELGHVALHLDGRREIVDLDVGGGGDRAAGGIEAEADAFAESAIISPQVWAESGLARGRVGREDVAAVARELRVHPALVAGRVRRETGDYRRFDELLGRGAVRAAFGPSIRAGA